MPPELEGISEFFDEGGDLGYSFLLRAPRTWMADGGGSQGLLLLLALFGCLCVTWVNRRYKKVLDRYLQVPSRNGFTAVRAAQRLLEWAGVLGVRIVPTHGARVTDHYHPFTKELALSHGIFHSSSLAALGIAAHEVGHAVQHARNYFPVWLRTVLVPLTNVCQILGLGAVCFGMIYSSGPLWTGAGLLACCLLFPLVTLPIEFDASARGRNLALEAGIIQADERAGIEQVLRAAALTYVGRTIAAALVLLGLSIILIFRSENSVLLSLEDAPLYGIIIGVVFLATIVRRRGRQIAAPGVNELNNTGNIHASQGDYVEAIAAFTKALHLDPQRSDIYANRGVCYYHTKQYDEALADLDAAVRLAPKRVEGYIWRGTVRFGRREYDQAVADFDLALKLDPDNIAGLRSRGCARLERRDLSGAQADFDRVLTLVPADALSHFSRGCSWCYQEDYDRALADFNQALIYDGKHAESYAMRAMVRLVKGEHDQAIADYTEALRLGGNRAAILRDRGVAWLQKGDLDQALKDLDESLRLNAEDAVAYNNRAATFQKKGAYARAASDLQQALRLNPSLPNAYKNLAWLQATCPEAEFRDGTAAVANASRALQLSNGKAPAGLEILAAAHAEAGNFEEAVRLQAKYLAESPAGTQTEMQARLDLYRAGQAFRENLAERGLAGRAEPIASTIE